MAAPAPLRRALLLAVVVFALCAPASASAAPVGKEFVGMIADDVLAGDSAYRAAQLQAQSDAGVGLTRAPFAWNTIETSPGQYDFSFHDGYVADVAKKGMDVLPVLVWSPAFRSSAPTGDPNPTKYPPKDPADLGTFAAVLVRRYGPNGTFWAAHPEVPKRPIKAWQVWNEPNLPSYWPNGPNPRQYTQLLKATSSAIKAADPTATVVAAGMPQTGGGATPLLTFVNEMEAAGAASAYDAMAVHAYGSDDEETLQRVRDVRSLMNARGDTKPIWVTEVGWGTAGTPYFLRTDEQGQADRLGCAVARLAQAKDSLRVQRVVEYDWRDDAPYAATGHWSQWAGLLRSDGSAKPSLAAFKASALKAEGAPALGNRPPVACFKLSEPAPVTGEQVTFSSTSTDAPDGTIASQAWDLDNDGAFDDGSGTSASRSFPSPGTYTVRLEVTDNGGASQTISRQVTVGAGARVSGSTLAYTARAGEANDVTVSSASGAYTIRDTGAAMTPGPGCSAVDANTVRCTGSINSIQLDLRDGNDSATNATATGSTLTGGRGDDTLRGGSGSDVFDQGSAADGSDALYGGGGVDTVHYGDRALPVRVSLDNVRNDGEDSARDGTAEEADDVRSDVENVTGGWGADVLTGSAAANALNDGAGSDTMRGLDGNDSFVQQGGLPNGPDVMIGGNGRDNVSYKSRKAGLRVSLNGNPDDGADVHGDGTAEEGDDVRSDVEDVTGGTGPDRLEGSSAANSLVAYKGDDTVIGNGGDDSLDGQSGADRLSGGTGNDKALYASRSLPVTADIDGVEDDGTTEDVSGSKRDNVLTDIESLVGGAGDDTLTGSPAANTLDGGKGADALSGLDGADTLRSFDGVADRSVGCGAGTDSADADASDPVASDCESVTRH